MMEDLQNVELFLNGNSNTVGQKLLERKETVAVAESVTGGLLQLMFASMSDAVQFFNGGMTAYTPEQKIMHLHVDPIEAEQYNSVSFPIARTMASEVSEKFGTNWGISITGYASPVKESGFKLFAYYAIALEGKIVQEAEISVVDKSGLQVKLVYAEQVLRAFFQLLKARIPY